MTDLYSEYRRKSGAREDPRLARRDTKTVSNNDYGKQQYDKLGIPISPKRTPPTPSPTKESSIADMSWQSQAQNNQYGNANMQTAYQHLMYNDPNQYSNQGYSTSYGSYQQSYVPQSTGYDPYQNYNQSQTGYSSGNLQPGPPGEDYPQNEWGPAYPAMCQPPNLPAPVTQQATSKSDDHKKEAVAQELKQQKAQMAKQREQYVRKVGVLRRELEMLAEQKQNITTQGSSDKDSNHILRENDKLQIEIQNKMKTIHNVIEMLNNIIGDGRLIKELEEMYKDEPPKQREKTKSISSEIVSSEVLAKYCYVYYDPELHWCRICDVFPKSAKEYLLHLHSKEHRQVTQKRDMVDTPWHRMPVEPELPSNEAGPKKRIPIKGLQFLISSTAWYCKLCDTWVGDLHCASQHLKSQNHNQNYANFVEQNPHWEIEWLRDRDKAYVRTKKNKRSESEEDSENEELQKRGKKRKDKSPSTNRKDKKKKKQKRRKKHSSDSSSSSSDSDSSSEDDKNDNSKSIRVAMRNKMKLQAQMILNEDVGGKWEVLGRLVEEHKRKEASEASKEVHKEDKLINQWMTVSEPPDKDKKLFDSLKDRMKLKQEAEKTRLAEIEKKRLEKEKQEKELKEKLEREAREKEEEKRRQQEELEKQKERDREQIRFKPRDKINNTNNKRRSSSVSPDRNRTARSRSGSTERRRRERSPERYRKDNHYNGNGRRRSPSYERRDSPSRRKSDRDADRKDRKSSYQYKKPHFIGRMPLFKNKKNEEKVEVKEIKKEDYDIPRQSRFQPGNLARAFIPQPDVVCFPRLSCIPPLMIPPPPSVVIPDPPVITSPKLQAPPPPIIKNSKEEKAVKEPSKTENGEKCKESVGNHEDEATPLPPPPPLVMKEMEEDEIAQNQMQAEYQESNMYMYQDPSQMENMMQYQYNVDYNNMMYSQMYDYQEVSEENTAPPPPESIPVEHTMPLPPPPLPPDDPNEDLAMLGMSADDMAAQLF